MKNQIINAFLLLILANNTTAITDAVPEKDISLEMETPHSRQPGEQLAPPGRGELLYMNHCRACHESTVHIREIQRAKDLNAIRNEVSRWSKELQLKWSLYDIEEVVDYLNNRFYYYSE